MGTIRKLLPFIGVAMGAALALGGCSTGPTAGSPQPAPMSIDAAGEPTETVDPVDALWSQMDDRKKIASVLMLNYPGEDFGAIGDFLAHYHLGGVILMGDNIPEDDDVLAEAISQWQGQTPLNYLIGIDEEGGVVRRLEADDFPAGADLRDADPGEVEAAFSKRADLLNRLGININFGVIADYTDATDSFISDRVLGTTPMSAANNVAAAVKGERGKVLTTLKHFPGHGLTDEDSHLTIPSSPVTEAHWRDGALVSFQAGIQSGAEAVMVGHLLLPAIDDEPASLSPGWYKRLREEDFTGIAVTDDMSMLRDSGLPEYQDPVRNATLAINAGASLVLDIGILGVSPDDFATDLIDGLVEALDAGVLSREALDDAGHRVLQARYALTDGADTGL